MSDSTVTIFGLSVLALLLAGYLGQQYLPPPKPRIVGIDLGTTYSCIAVYHAVTGEVEIIPDSEGHKTIPSIVAFTPERDEVGYTALSHAEEMPESTLYDAKRFIGKVFTEAELAKEIERYQFKVNIDKNGNAFFNVEDRLITPEEVGSQILNKLKEQAETTLEVPIKMAVMAVPAEFDERQRNATKQAAKLAGMEVLRIINEPTAAALAYGLHRTEGMANIIVIDMGGGTLDVSLLNVQGGMFQTFAMAGNNHLGGQDINYRLVRFILDLIERKHHKRVTHPEDLQRLRLFVEDAKINLTSHNSTAFYIRLPSIGENVEFSYNLTREKFESLNDDIFQRVLDPVKVVLKTAEMEPSDIDDIVLVGGSTRIPRVRAVIKDFFNKVPNTKVYPELAVAYGVALQAGIIGGAWPLQVSAIEVYRTIKKINVQ